MESGLPTGWDHYDPNEHERTGEPGYEAARSEAAAWATRRRARHAELLAALRSARSTNESDSPSQPRHAIQEGDQANGKLEVTVSMLMRRLEGLDSEPTLVVAFADGDSIELSLLIEELEANES